MKRKEKSDEWANFLEQNKNQVDQAMKEFEEHSRSFDERMKRIFAMLWTMRISKKELEELHLSLEVNKRQAEESSRRFDEENTRRTLNSKKKHLYIKNISFPSWTKEAS